MLFLEVNPLFECLYGTNPSTVMCLQKRIQKYPTQPVKDAVAFLSVRPSVFCFFILPPCHWSLIPKSKHLTLSHLDQNQQQLLCMSRGDEGQTFADECRETPGGETGSPETDAGMLIFFLLWPPPPQLFMLHAGRVNMQTQHSVSM